MTRQELGKRLLDETRDALQEVTHLPGYVSPEQARSIEARARLLDASAHAYQALVQGELADVQQRLVDEALKDKSDVEINL